MIELNNMEYMEMKNESEKIIQKKNKKGSTKVKEGEK